MNYVEANAHIISCAYDSMGRDEMKRFFYADFIGIMETLVDSVERELGVDTPSDFKSFLCELYTEALASMLIEWAKDRTKYGRDKVLQYLSVILRTSLPAVLTKAGETAKSDMC